MADEQIPPEVEATINAGMDEPAPKPVKVVPSYQIISKSKIPVSSATGALWKARKKQGKKAIEEVAKCWEEAVDYFNNDHSRRQSKQLGDDIDQSNSNEDPLALDNNLKEVENIVFANVTTITPMLYSKNPQVEFSIFNEDMQGLARACEKLVNELLAKKYSPGVNLKPKAKRAVVTTLLCNRSWIEVGWTFKDDSSEQALEDLKKLSDELDKAKTKQEIEAVEGKIMALEDQLDILQPAGPYVRFRRPDSVIVDPNAAEIDLSDANWLIIDDMLPTSYIQAKFGKKNPDDASYSSLYQPTHTMKVGQSEEASDGSSPLDYSMFEENSAAATMKSMGYDEEESYRRSQYTSVSYVWDKVTRRLLVFNSKDWTWPLWVWDDPYGLEGFFPAAPLTFYESPEGPATKGEVSYYLDQQDAINEIVSEEKTARGWARRNVVFDNSKGLTQGDVEALLKGADGTARGIKVPDGMKITDIITSIIPPSMNYKELWNKEDKYKAVDRISSVSEAMRGEQFKTNTTNDAVEANVGAANMRIEEKADSIEDWVGAIGWMICQLCLQFMPPEQVAYLIGDVPAQDFKTMTAQDIRTTFCPRVIGGSTQKQTSKAKKDEAIKLGQVLGQFVNTPAGPIVLKIMLKMLSQAFDEVTIDKEDWDKIAMAIPGPSVDGEGAPTGAPMPPGSVQPNAGAVPPGGAPPAGAGGPPGQGDQMQQLLAALPMNLKQQAAQEIQGGADPRAALMKAMQSAQAMKGQPNVPSTQPVH